MKNNYIYTFIAVFSIGLGLGFFQYLSCNYVVVYAPDGYNTTHVARTMDKQLSDPITVKQMDYLAPTVYNQLSEPEDWEIFVKLLPRNTTMPKCSDLFKNLLVTDHFMEKYHLFLDKVEEMMQKYGEEEGNVGKYRGQQRLYVQLANMGFVNNICEVGFNFGHSAILWLGSTQNTMLYSFDLLVHKYIRDMVSYFKDQYQDRFHIIYGDSTLTVPAFHKQKPYLLCDVAVIDGGHDYLTAKADLVNMRLITDRKRNIVIFDDYPSQDSDFMEGLGRAWREMQEEGKLKHLFSCISEDGFHGFSIGQYIYD